MADEDHRDTWLWLGGALVGVALTSAAIGGGFAAARPGYDLWTSPPFLVSYVTSMLALFCFVGAIRHWPIPFSSSGRPPSDLRMPGAAELARPSANDIDLRRAAPTISSRAVTPPPQPTVPSPPVPPLTEPTRVDPTILLPRLRQLRDDGAELLYKIQGGESDGGRIGEWVQAIKQTLGPDHAMSANPFDFPMKGSTMAGIVQPTTEQTMERYLAILDGIIKGISDGSIQ